MTATDIDVVVSAGVMEATFNRPERLNAIRRQTLDELVQLLERAEADQSVRVLVFTGRGRAFSAGQDLVELDELLTSPNGAGREQVETLQAITRRLIGHRVVTIAALNGIAVGFGAELAVSCDIRLASPDARIGFVEASRGLFQTNGITWLLPRLVGHGRALDLLLSGDLIDGEQAHRIGLVSRLATDNDALTSASTMARRIASNAPLSLELIKRSMRAIWTSTLEEALETEVTGMVACLGSDDLREGTTAFLEKRRPVFQGR